MLGLDEAQAGIKIAGRNISSFRYADETTLMAESEEELKSILMKVPRLSLVVVSGGYPLLGCSGLLIALASLVTKHGL